MCCVINIEPAHGTDCSNKLHTHAIIRLTVSHVFQGDFIALDIMKIRISKLNTMCRRQVRIEKETSVYLR